MTTGYGNALYSSPAWRLLQLECIFDLLPKSMQHYCLLATLCVCEYVKLICDVRSGCWYHKAAASVAAAPIVAACITSIVGSPAPKSMLQIALIPQRK